VDVKTADITALTVGNGNWSTASYSKDGKKIAYSGITAWDRTSPTSDIWVMNADGSNKKAITALQQADQAGTKKSVELTKKLSLLNGEQIKLTTMMGELGSDSLASVAKIDEIGVRVDQLNGSQQKLSLSVEQRRRALDNRLRSVEKAIESIDSFRRQTNQTLDSMRQAPSVSSLP